MVETEEYMEERAYASGVLITPLSGEVEAEETRGKPMLWFQRLNALLLFLICLSGEIIAGKSEVEEGEGEKLLYGFFLCSLLARDA